MYRAVPITQRDGSALASSNCRMAAGATAIDFDTLGATTSTGADMRERQSDQSGGTDSGDLAQAWRSYSQTLRIRDGATWDDAMADLRAGRALVLDVWHAAAGGPCLSGSGAYGHSMAIAPEFHSDGARVLVADPWCSPGKWGWWPISQLAHGAQVWGDQVYGRSTGGPLALLIRELMTRWRPGQEARPSEVLETGGGGRILYSTSDAHPEVVDMPGLILEDLEPWSGSVTMRASGASAIVVADRSLVGIPPGGVKTGYMLAELGEAFGSWPAGTPVVAIGDELAVIIVEQAELEADAGGGDETPDDAYRRGTVDEYNRWYAALGLPDPPEV